MELRQLKYFIKSAELQNFTEASKQLYITQSTLSQQIKQLETELNVPLFDRIGKKVVITEAGKEFLPFAKQTIQDADLGKQRILDLQDIRTGSIKIGITYSLSFGLSSIILRFMKEYPNIKIEILYNPAHELPEMLKNRDIDFALSFNSAFVDEQIEVTDLFDGQLCAIVQEKHPIAICKQISIKDLRQHLLALPSKGLNARSFLDEILEDCKTTLDPHLEMNDVNMLLQLVEDSHFATILSKTTILGKPKLRAIPIKEQKAKMTASLLTLKGAYQKASARKFSELFISTFKANKD
ncbi:MAG: LysR substrate-binding domain-containing protein [Paludibacteraceae bacterium]|nr:LysR family transcriptional regulator [Prevotellaceae bacterium]